MTVIRLDQATLDKFRTTDGPVLLCDEAGRPVRVIDLLSPADLDREPEYTEEEWQAIENDPVTYTTEEVLAHLRSLGQE